MIRIKISKRLLATAIVGTALVISAVMMVSMRGNDKPTIETNPPADDKQPANSPVTPQTNNVSPNTVEPTEPDEPTNDKPGNGHHNGNGNGNGHHDADDDVADEGKARGLARAIEVHQNNIEKMTQKGKTVPQGLQMSLDKLVTMNAEKLGSEHGNNQDNNGQHKGQSQGHNSDT